MIFPEAMTELADVRPLRRRGEGARSSPTSPSSARRRCSRVDELRGVDVDIVLYLLSAFRAMNAGGAEGLSGASARDGTQKNVVDTMQTRADLYEYLGYHAYEQKLDALFARSSSTRHPRTAGH